MKKIIFTLALFAGIQLSAQTITPQVINSAGDHRAVGATGITLTDNVGEPFTETLGPNGNIMISQGFLQPDIISVLGPSVSVLKNDVSCSDKNDGNISIAITNTTSNFIVTYSWTPPAVCPGNCAFIDSLKPGIYSVVVIVTNTITNKTDTVKPLPIIIADQNGPCKVKIYTGITPNGDGNNDVFIIDNIEEFPNNNVSIFNRWGVKLFDKNNYNNKDVAWPLKDDINGLPPSTYFYILNLGNGTVLKGWVELLKD
ncbi:MAG: hypothetical protein K0S32_1240 [Bacteroidetes bacterium]|jgi:gliding motility-associated-like protein|nr:hypothetical protein [Bacteroidota bacterium]